MTCMRAAYNVIRLTICINAMQMTDSQIFLLDGLALLCLFFAIGRALVVFFDVSSTNK